MNGFFVNHETSKLWLPDPASSVVLVYAFLIAAAALSYRKSQGQKFLDFGQTEQMKGLAILLIVVGHTHLILSGPDVPRFADFGVGIFLFCSGYGLTISAAGKGLTLKGFLLKRASRIYMPYWATTLLVLTADYLLSSKGYSAAGMAATFAGFNFTEETIYIDWARWFVTYIIIMYAFFFVSMKAARSDTGRVAVLVSLVLAMDVLMTLYRIKHISGNYVLYSLMFPAGCIAAMKRGRIEAFFDRARGMGLLRLTALASFFLFFPVRYLTDAPLRTALKSSGAMVLVNQLTLLIFTGLLLLVVYVFRDGGHSFGLLSVAGGLSYEIFLLHDVFLMKYDFLVHRSPFVFWFMVFLAMVFFLALILNRLVSRRSDLLFSETR